MSGNQPHSKHLLPSVFLCQGTNHRQYIYFNHYICVTETTNSNTSTSIGICVSEIQPLSKHPIRSVYLCQGINHSINKFVSGNQPSSTHLLRSVYWCQGTNQIQNTYFDRYGGVRESTKFKATLPSVCLCQGIG